MAAPLLTVLAPALLQGARELLDRVLPDPEQRARAELELMRAQAEGTFQQRAEQALRLAQIGVNSADAASGSLYRGGWRPGAGWVCVSALAWQFVVAPVATWGAALAGYTLPTPPTLDGMLWELLAVLLGLGTLRTAERFKGRA